METKETYDRWEKDHPFLNKEHSLYRLIEKWLKENGQAFNRISIGRNDREKRILEYILYSLDQKQEYDAGNAILWASQVGWLSDNAISMLADIFISNEVEFTSKIGKLMFIKIGRFIGIRLCLCGNKQVGLKLFEMAIDATKTLSYGKTKALKDWEALKLKAKELPEAIQRRLNDLQF